MLHRVLKITYHFTVYAVGICVLLAAISVTIIRLLLPDVGMYRGEIEAWVSEYMGFPVAIRSLDASWEGWIPHLYLRDIDLLNRKGTEAITHFDNAQITIAPIATLLQRQFVPRQLTVSGFHLNATRQEDGSIYVQGIHLEERPETTRKRNELAEWLFRQQKIEIQNAKINWIDKRLEQDALLLNDVQLALRTDQDRIQIEGSAQLPRAYGGKLNFAFDATGDLMTSDWSGELYLEGKNINPDNWYRQYRPFELNVAGGTADMRVWSTWDDARIRTVEGELEYNEFSAFIGEKDLRVEKMDYAFLGERINEGDWQFSINLNDFVTENGAWPEASLVLTAHTLTGRDEYSYAAGFSYLKLGDLVPLLGNLSFIPEKVRSNLEKLKMNGNLINGEVHYNPLKEPGREFSYDIRFDRLTTRIDKSLPQVKALSGHATGNLEQGAISFSGDSAELLVPGVRDEAIPVSAIDGRLEWSRTGNRLTLYSPLLTLANMDLSVRLAGTAVMEKDTLPYLDLVAELGGVNLETFKRYVPYTPKFKMRPWMEKSVLGGELTSATALIRGHLGDFPFRDRSGRFKAIANVENGVMEYSDKWPVVDNINTEVTIDAMRVSGNSIQGQVYGATFDNGHVIIPDVFRQQKYIFIDGTVVGKVADLKTFTAHSPLINDLSINELHKALIGGWFSLDLDMKIPWKIPEEKPGLNGSIELSEVNLKSSLSKIELNDIKGNVEFSRGSVSGTGLTANYLGMPVSLAINGSREEEESDTAITLMGNTDKNFIADQVGRYLPGLAINRQLILDRISGKADWEATLRYHKPAGEEKLQRSLTLMSDLRGINVALPAPLDKKSDKEKTLHVFRRLNESDPPLIELEYGSDLRAEFMLSAEDGQTLQSANVHFGDRETVPVSDGIMIGGNIDSLSISEWWGFLKETGKDNKAIPARTLAMDLQINDLGLLSQNFTDVGLKVQKSGNDWSLDVDSESIAGQIVLPEPLTRNSHATIDLERLHLQSIDKMRHSSLDPHALPAITADIENFSYDGKDLGKLHFSASPSYEGMTFNTIRFSKPGMTIHGEGNWASGENGDESSFGIEVHAEKIDTMLKTFGYDVTAIKNGETTLLINADWEGTPMQFALEKLNGSISMKINNGQLLNVEPAAGRLFGLLSIQALPRRLTLDFRDLFSKGLAFDRIEGNFDVANGNAYTNDLFMSGPAANVAISGRTGLSEKDYDQRVTVTPQVSESLPVAGAIFGPVGIGIGAVFYLAGEMFESLRNNIDSLLRYQYTITGSWEDPVVEKINPVREASG